jgi:DNA-binding FadR family transcriptional regulator
MSSTASHESLAETAERQIYDYVKSNNLKPGDAFPREADLAEMLQASRPVVREALSRFRMLGLVKSRRRRGMILSKPSIFETLKKILDPFFLSKEEKQDFYNLRVIIELGLSDVLAFNVTDADLEVLEEIVNREEAHPEDFNLYLECDYQFHLQIYKSTKCTALESFQNLLYRNFSDAERAEPNSQHFLRRFTDSNMCSHRDVLEAIKTRIPDVIHSTIKRHLSHPLEMIKKSTMNRASNA